MLGIEFTGKPPFHTIYMHGLVRDGNGQKMSKTKGNVIDPIDTLDEYGTDALRLSLVTGCTPGQDIPLSMEKVIATDCDGLRRIATDCDGLRRIATDCD